MSKQFEWPKHTQYPRVWVAKKDKKKKKIRVMPWWEVVKDGKVERVDELGVMISESVAGRPCKFGILTQIGFLLENEHGVWFGIGPRAHEGFDDLGEWKAPKEKKK